MMRAARSLRADTIPSASPSANVAAVATSTCIKVSIECSHNPMPRITRRATPATMAGRMPLMSTVSATTTPMTSQNGARVRTCWIGLSSP
jgi:hypothetical protein